MIEFRIFGSITIFYLETRSNSVVENSIVETNGMVEGKHMISFCVLLSLKLSCLRIAIRFYGPTVLTQSQQRVWFVGQRNR